MFEKIMLLQLPVQWQKRDGAEFANYPLAAAYLKAMAYREGLLKEMDIELVGPKWVNLRGDDAIIQHILSQRPDAVGFSLYPWNILRAKHLMREIKIYDPRVRILAGGPEVQLSNRLVTECEDLDFGIIGEGEQTFVDLLKHIRAGSDDPDQVKGLFFRHKEGVHYTGPRDYILDLDSIPSPHLLGYLAPFSDNRFFILELNRGCIQKCKYCCWWKRGNLKFQRFSVNRLAEELRFAKQKGGNFIKFNDAALQFSKGFKELLPLMKEINREKQIIFKGYFQPEFIDEAFAEDLKECNFQTIEVGLQSANMAALKEVNRWCDLNRLLRGIEVLLDKGFDITIDLIIGLPGETSATIKETLSFLEKHNLTQYAAAGILSVGPATDLFEEKDKYGLAFQDLPAYRILSTNSLNCEEIKEAFQLFQERCPPMKPGTYSDYHTIPLVSTYSKGTDTNGSSDAIGHFVEPVESSPLSLICEFTNIGSSIERSRELAKRLSDKMNSRQLLWFNSGNLSADLPSVRDFLSTISSKNPFTLWRIFLESSSCFPSVQLEMLRNCIQYQYNYVDGDDFYHMSGENNRILNYRSSSTFYLILPFPLVAYCESTISEYMTYMYLLWTVFISTSVNIEEVIRAVFDLPGDGVIFDFDSQLSPRDVFKVLSTIRKCSNNKREIRFRNIVLERYWASGCNFDNIPYYRQRPLYHYKITSIEDITTHIHSPEDIRFDCAEWKLASGRK